MCGLQGRQNSLGPSQGFDSRQGVAILTGRVLDPPSVFPVAVLGPDAGIIQAGRDRMDVQVWPSSILQDIAVAAMQNTRLTIRQRAA